MFGWWGRENCAIGFVKNLPTKCGGIVKTKNSFELGFCLQMARNGQKKRLMLQKCLSSLIYAFIQEFYRHSIQM